MAIELRWLASESASMLHAAGAMLVGRRLVDQKTAAALATEVDGLRRDLERAGLPEAKFLEHALGASTQIHALARLAEVVVGKIVGPAAAGPLVPALARRLTALEAAFQKANPRVADELEARSGPLREQWEARGPGLIAALGRSTEPGLLVERADAVLVHPVLGGGGAAQVLYNSVRIEGVLANPVPELPEVVRLGWMLGQLNLDLGRFTDFLSRDRLAEIGSLAMIPPALAAAEEVELARCNVQSIATAIEAWHCPAADAAKLFTWWQTCVESHPPWTVALGALDQMLAE